LVKHALISLHNPVLPEPGKSGTETGSFLVTVTSGCPADLNSRFRWSTQAACRRRRRRFRKHHLHM